MQQLQKIGGDRGRSSIENHSFCWSKNKPRYLRNTMIYGLREIAMIYYLEKEKLADKGTWKCSFEFKHNQEYSLCISEPRRERLVI